MKMPTLEIEEFAKKLVQQVRDESIRGGDMLITGRVRSPQGLRWKALALPATDTLTTLMPDVVDEVVFNIFRAIDDGTLALKYVSEGGNEVDLVADGHGELAGWYMGSGGWRALYSTERFIDDCADLTSVFDATGSDVGNEKT